MDSSSRELVILTVLILVRDGDIRQHRLGTGILLVIGLGCLHGNNRVVIVDGNYLNHDRSGEVLDRMAEGCKRKKEGKGESNDFFTIPKINLNTVLTLH